jgi:hypothetical protein
VVRYGRTVPRGFLPVHSVDTEDEAQRLLVLACETNVDGEFIARELAFDQTVPSLFTFGRRLAEAHKMMKKRAAKKGGA